MLEKLCVAMTTQQSYYDEMDMDRPKVCGGSMFLKFMKTTEQSCGPSGILHKRQKKKNKSCLRNTSSSSLRSSISYALPCSSSFSRAGRSFTTEASDPTSDETAPTSSTNPVHVHDPSKTRYCMPRKIGEACSKLDFKLLHEKVNSDVIVSTKMVDDDNLEENELQSNEHSSAKNIIQIFPHLISDLKTEHMQSIGDNIGCAANRIETKHGDTTTNTVNNKLESRACGAPAEVTSELDQVDVDAAWQNDLQRIFVTKHNANNNSDDDGDDGGNGERRNITNGRKSNQRSYESEGLVIKNKTKSFRHELNPWLHDDDDDDNDGHDISQIDNGMLQMRDNSSARGFFKSDWNLNFHDPGDEDDDDKVEELDKLPGKVVESTNIPPTFDEELIDNHKNTSSEPKLHSEIESNYSRNLSVESKFQGSKYDVNNSCVRSLTRSTTGRIGSSVTKRLTVDDYKVMENNKNKNIHNRKKTSIPLGGNDMLVREKGEVYHDCPTQQKSFVPMPEIMNCKKNNNSLSKESDYRADMKVVRTLLKKYSYDEGRPPVTSRLLKNDRRIQSGIVSHGNPTIIDASLDSWFHRHAALATTSASNAQVKPKHMNNTGCRRIQQQRPVKKIFSSDTGNLASRRKSFSGDNLSPKKTNAVPVFNKRNNSSLKKCFSEDTMSTNNNNYVLNNRNNRIAKSYSNDNESMRDGLSVGKLSPEKIKFWETSN